MMIFNLPCSSSPCPLISWSFSSRHAHTHSHTHSHTYTHAHTHTLFVEAKRTHSPIFQSFLFELHLDAPAPPSPLLTPTWGRVSDEVWAERRTLICINLQAISREVARFEGGENKSELLHVPPGFTSAVTNAAATWKQEASNQSSSPHRLVQSDGFLTHELITSPSPHN